MVKLICDKEEGVSSDNAGCVCHACYKQAARNVGNPNFHPRWHPKKPPVKEACSVFSCSKEVFRHTTVASREQIEFAVGEYLKPLPSQSAGAAPASTPLCQLHYANLNSILNARQCCESCGSKPKWGEKDYYRHCPTPQAINSYLNTISGETSSLSEESKICMSCYRLFNRVNKQLPYSENPSETLKTINDKLALKLVHWNIPR